jgi:uncharacterized membrane protein HdeD (DUF308 family)
MSEKRLLNCIMIEGIMLIILSLCLLILPKLTTLSYGVMLSCTFITYGIYKIIYSIISKDSGLKMALCIAIGLFLSVIGTLILFVPKVNLLWIIALIGVYLILESISSIVYALKLRNVYHFWGCKIISAIILFIAAILIILGLPVISFFMVSVLCGIALLVKGMSKLTLSISNIDFFHN